MYTSLDINYEIDLAASTRPSPSRSAATRPTCASSCMLDMTEDGTGRTWAKARTSASAVCAKPRI